MISRELAAKIVEAEAGVLDYAGKVAVAQCIMNNDYNAAAFTTPAETYSRDSILAVRNTFRRVAYRFFNAKILQFRSFTKYADTDFREPDWKKIYSGVCPIPEYLMYLGKDYNPQTDMGHFYFGRYTNLKPFKLLLIAGHGKNQNGSWDPGAIGCGYQEADLNRELVAMIKQCCDVNDLDCDVITEPNMCDYFRKGNEFDFTPYNYVLEIHFNASPTATEIKDGKMIGSMFFIDQSETGHSVEDAILDKLYEIGSTKAWDGVVTTQRNYPRGLVVQNKVRSQGVSHAVLETCFVTDGDDMEWYQSHKAIVATKIVEGVIKGFGLNEATPNYTYCGYGIATMTAKEEMNVRESPTTFGTLTGFVSDGAKVEVLDILPSGWMRIVWPGSPYGYAYTSNVGGKYYG